MSTDPRVVILLGVMFFCGFYTPAIQLAPDDWCLLYIGSCVVAAAAPPLYSWDAALQLSTPVLLHDYMLHSPSEALEGCCDGLARLQQVHTIDKDKRHAVRQEKAIQALREFAEATGNALPENLKSLKPQE
ncbi:hypothetical protein SELMODRAFT_403961 [Selaginella moellendorffii]|uniref:Uncharacterized protein n=1 Tax=Selaginella moellendorffii TaxID=88036 RepID=D8QT46_SELML|nr:hypothetical protein SELMODRAFT_403961 [Selaginella moellendorffii]